MIKFAVNTESPIDWDNIEDQDNYILNEDSDLAAKALERLSIIKSTVLWLEKCESTERFVIKRKILGESFLTISNALNISKTSTYTIWKNAIKKAEGLYNV